MMMAHLKNMSTNHLWGYDLPFIEKPFILMMPQKDAVSYLQAKVLRPYGFNVSTFNSNMLPRRSFWTSTKHVHCQP